MPRRPNPMLRLIELAIDRGGLVMVTALPMPRVTYDDGFVWARWQAPEIHYAATKVLDMVNGEIERQRAFVEGSDER
jgi:hypothetical protein